MKNAGASARRALIGLALSCAVAAALPRLAHAQEEDSSPSAESEAWSDARSAASAPSAPALASAPAASATRAVVSTRPASADAGSSDADSASNMIETPAELPPLPPASDRSDLAVQPQGASKPPALSSAQANAFASQADADVSAYQYRQNGAAASRRMQAMAQYLGDSGFSTDLGMELEQSRQRLKSGETALGLLVVAVQKDSAASAAGIRPFKHGVHDALAGVAAATSVLVPVAAPLAMLAIPALDFFEVGESYDMIVGIDGNRVTSYADFIERLRNLQPGELIYLSIVRNGKRLQLSMPVPATTSSSMP